MRQSIPETGWCYPRAVSGVLRPRWHEHGRGPPGCVSGPCSTTCTTSRGTMLPADFACGYQWYRDSLPEAVETVPRIVVTLVVEDQEIAALVDTGANHLLLEWTIARP